MRYGWRIPRTVSPRGAPRRLWRTLPPMNRIRGMRILKILGKTGVTLLLAWLVMRRIDTGALAATMRGAHIAYLLAAVGVYFSSFLASTVRSGLFLSDAGVRLGFFEGLRLYLLGVVGNLALPGGIGGDGYKVLRLRASHDISGKTILKAFLLERLSGLWAIGAWLACLSFGVSSLPFHGLPLLVAFGAGTVCYVFLWKRFFPEHAVGMGRKLALSLAIQGLVSVSVLCILASQPSAFAPASYLFGFHASTVLSILNIGLSGLGVREFVMGYAADTLGNDPLLSVFTASAFWVISTVAALPGLWVFWKDGFRPEVRKGMGRREDEPLISS